MDTDQRDEQTASAAFSDARPQINFFIGACGVGAGIVGIFLGPMAVHFLLLPEEQDSLAVLFHGMNIGFAIGAGPGVILGGYFFRVTGRWWGAILGSLLGMAVSYQLQSWFQEDFLMFAYFILPTVLAVAAYQPIRPCSASDRWN
ncbi:MAG: hypothetical protein ACYDCO_23620 [Armatimonadota bacterium]